MEKTMKEPAIQTGEAGAGVAAGKSMTSEASAVSTTGSYVRFQVLGLAVLLSAITYFDRICISLTAPMMMKDLNLTPFKMSLVFSSFTLAYAIFEIPTGAWGDRYGTRLVLTRIVLWWSAFTVFTAGAFNYVSLLIVRFLFGAGEAGAWPNAARTFSRWFPITERGTAQGVFFMGAHLAGGLTPILVTAMLGWMHWRWVFVVFGVVGFLWAAAWHAWFRDEPEHHKSVSARELEHIQQGRVPLSSHHLTADGLKRILSHRSLLALCAMYSTQSYGFYFVITWLPTYLEKERGFTKTELGIMAGLPLLFSVIADLLGGFTTDRLTRRYGLRVGRSAVGGAAMLLASASIITGASVANAHLAIILIACAAAFANFLLGAAWGSCVDMGGNQAGVVSACMNTAGQIGGVFSPIVASLLVARFGWSAPLYVCGLLYFCGALCWALVDTRKKIQAI
jgi:MFS transporter, ACS family, glucarate transporter